MGRARLIKCGPCRAHKNSSGMRAVLVDDHEWTRGAPADKWAMGERSAGEGDNGNTPRTCGGGVHMLHGDNAAPMRGPARSSVGQCAVNVGRDVATLAVHTPLRMRRQGTATSNESSVVDCWCSM